MGGTAEVTGVSYASAFVLLSHSHQTACVLIGIVHASGVLFSSVPVRPLRLLQTTSSNNVRY